MIPMGDIIAHRLHEVIEDGELGIDYTFALDKDKNKTFRRKYILDDRIMIDILLKITGLHYLESKPSDNEEHLNDVVHIFKINESLVPRFEENPITRSVCIYVKVTWPESKDPMFIISFHEDNE